MASKLKSIKGTIIIAIILFSLFVAFSNTAMAPPWPLLNANIDVTWAEEDVEKPIIPRKEVRTLNLTVNFKVDMEGEISQGLVDVYKKIGALIRLEIVEYSPWCFANLQLDAVVVDISDEFKATNIGLNIQLKDEAPAYGEGYIVINAKAKNLALIGPISKDFTFNFIAAYFPIIDTTLPEGNILEVNPMDSAIFPIEVENKGNARTKVFLEIEDVPEGWTIAVTDELSLGEKKGSKGTAFLTVIPPKDFGYHHDRESITVKIVPHRAENLLEKGSVTYANFIVESRGFSTPGFEIIIFIGALIFISLIFKLKRKK